MKINLPSHSKMRTVEFTYGVATASFQIEGGFESRLPCIWDTFCDKPGAIKDNSDGKTACDHINRWADDIDLITSLGVDAYRLSIAWGRVINLDGTLNQQGADFYVAILDKLIENGIKPFVTLFHWDLPQHLEDEGGWLNRQTAYKFADYVDLITKAFGNRVHSYATLNEPFCSAYLGYELGIHAPGLKSKNYGKKAAHHLLLAHGLALTVLNKNSPNSLNGLVLNFTPAYAKTDSIEDKSAAKLADDHLNQWYIKPVMDGYYPDLINDLPEAQRPDIQPGDLQIISQPLDFLGVNYYTRAIYRADETHDFVEEKPIDAEFTDMGWEVYPQGFTDLLVSLNETYNLPPVYITENGTAMPDVLDNAMIDDQDRIAYFDSHLNAVNNAIEQGVNIQGYFAWSLMDNFEWAEGYLKRFGIVYVDYQSQVRTVKASGLAYRNFIGLRN